MAVENIQPELKNTEVITNGVETPSFVENIPSASSLEKYPQNPNQSDDKNEILKETLKEKEISGTATYDSKEEKSRALLPISPKDANSWSSIIKSKEQGAEITHL